MQNVIASKFKHSSYSALLVLDNLSKDIRNHCLCPIIQNEQFVENIKSFGSLKEVTSFCSLIEVTKFQKLLLSRKHKKVLVR